MNKNTSEEITTLAASVGAVISVASGLGQFSIWHTLIGLLLIVTLAPYWGKSGQSFSFHIVYSSVLSFCILLVMGTWIDNIFPIGNYHPDEKFLLRDPKDIELLLTWVLLSLFAFFVRWPFREKTS